MNSDFTKQYLLLNGKYFPNEKLQNAGKLLEKHDGLEYVANVKFWGSFKAVIYTFLFAPFDRLVLKDRFFGILKLAFTILVLWLLMIFLIQNKESVTINVLNLFDVILGVEASMYGILYWWIWQIIDLITAPKRVKMRNYKKFLEVVNKHGHIASITNKKKEPKEENNELKEWFAKNPNASLNDYYSRK